MWVVAQEDYDQTLVDFALLAESERLENAAETDRLFFLAKQIANGFAEPQKVWDEHLEFRASLVPTPAPKVSDDLMRRAAALFKRARAAEARHGAH